MESKYKVPTKFQIGSSDYSVIFEPSIDDSDLGGPVLGYQHYFKEKIVLALSYDSDALTEREIYKTFYHELTHAILSEMGEKELNDDERFVEGFSRLLVQFELSKKFAK